MSELIGISLLAVVLIVGNGYHETQRDKPSNDNTITIIRKGYGLTIDELAIKVIHDAEHKMNRSITLEEAKEFYSILRHSESEAHGISRMKTYGNYLIMNEFYKGGNNAE